MKRTLTMTALLCAAGLLTIAPLASGQQPKDKLKKGAAPPPSAVTKEPPKVAVVANVQVNISTSINIGGASGKPASPPERKAEAGKETSASGLLPSLEKASQGGSGVVVLANVKIDVATSVNINPSSGGAPSGGKQKQKAGGDKKPAVSATGGGVKTRLAAGSADDLFELHVRLRRTAGGIDVLLAGTAPSDRGAAAAAEQINQIREQGMVGLLVLPLILKTNADAARAVRSAWGSVKAEASGTRLTLTASIPNEAIAAAGDAADAALRFGRKLLGGK